MSTLHRPLLLNFPSEIRNMIWEHVLGGKSIHMDVCYHGDQHHALTKRCRNHPFITEIAELPLPNPTDITMWLKTRYAWPQSPAQLSPEDYRCRYPIHYEGPQSRAQHRCVKSQSRPRLDLELLRTSRQINDEAMSILYTTNVFSFMLLSHFAEFLLRLKDRPRSYLKAIHLSHWWRTWRNRYHPEPKSWPSIIGSLPLPALDTIYIEVQNTFTPDVAKIQTDAKDKVIESLRTIQWLIENKGWNIKRIPLGWSMWDGKGNLAQDQVLPQWLTIKKELIAERTTLLRRARAIAEEQEKASAEGAKGTKHAKPTTVATPRAKRGNTTVGQEANRVDGHEVEAITDSKYGPGRGGPVIYLVRYVDPSVPEWKTYTDVKHLGDHLEAFHEKHPDSPRHMRLVKE